MLLIFLCSIVQTFSQPVVLEERHQRKSNVYSSEVFVETVVFCVSLSKFHAEVQTTHRTAPNQRQAKPT